MVSRPHTPALADLPYRPCVGIALFNRDGLVFAGRRRLDGDPGLGGALGGHAWQMPQGGIDPGEAPGDAALRELYEETSVPAGSVRLLGEAPGWYSYDLPTLASGKLWKGRYRGQTQKWFAFAFLGSDDEIDIHHPGGGSHKAEFDDWRWEPLDRLPELIVPFKRPVYEQVVAAFAPYARPA
ncbi:RNA pyrophosphohydrolase [Methylobacterium oryzihabitans]|uniref:RNA pyrophosphohydrolase n=1 Tax=Methylobacterium oryzihabitans TaxID=2499852 RepID=A0A3S2V9H8_9HYPH|nr:RNA pyrophosphohydrolase [Methylobacterium oryzihabitans]RVU19058.1 RNA pyrophosphohydrolase [Methylobacterium oryzihabitans]